MEQTNLNNNYHFKVGKIEDYLKLKLDFEKKEDLKQNYFIIVFVTDGEGKLNIDFQEVDIKNQRLYFVSPGQFILNSSNNIKGYYISFDLNFYHSIKLTFKLYDFPFFHSSQVDNFLDIQDDLENIEDLITNIFLEYSKKEEIGKWTILRYELEVLLIKLVRVKQNIKSDFKEVLVANNEKLRQLELLIEDNFRKHKEVTFYAEKLNLSTRHLNNIISDKTGKSISEMITHRIFIESKRQLLYTDKTISEIAYELGFNDKTYFHRFFKKITSITPLQFRQDFLKVH